MGKKKKGSGEVIKLVFCREIVLLGGQEKEELILSAEGRCCGSKKMVIHRGNREELWVPLVV